MRTHVHTARSGRSLSSIQCLSVGCAAFSAAWLFCASAHATPGTHPELVSTWDSTSSSVQGGFTSAFFSGGHLDFGSYYANFSSTSGNISAQFGLHYVNYVPGADIPAQNGFAGSATFVYSHPVLGRWNSGLPKLGLGFYLGGAPTATFSLSGSTPTVSSTGVPTASEETAASLWIPFAAGFAIPTAPAEFISIVPWVEVAAGPSIDLGAAVKTVMMVPVPSTTSNVGGAVDLRGGLKLDFHLGRAVDAGASLFFANFGSGFDGPFAVFVGGHLTVHWDDVVAAVLTPEERLSHEACSDIEERMRDCPRTLPAPSTSPRPGYVQTPAATPAPRPAPSPVMPSTMPVVPLTPTPSPAPAPAPPPPSPAPAP